MARDRFEWYPTPAAFTHFLFDSVYIRGRVFSPCNGDGAIMKAAKQCEDQAPGRKWITNDIDKRWKANYHRDARDVDLWNDVVAEHGDIDWVVDNPPFTIAIEIAKIAIQVARVGVALHLRTSIHEPIKRTKSERHDFMPTHPLSDLLFLPRFGFQRSPTTGKWATDSVCSCWCVWRPTPPLAPAFTTEPLRQRIKHAPASVLDKLKAETPAYRNWVDRMQAKRSASK